MARVVRIVINDKAFIDFTPEDPATFNLAAFHALIRGNGVFIMGDTVAIPYNQIEMVLWIDPEANAPLGSVQGMSRQ